MVSVITLAQYLTRGPLRYFSRIFQLIIKVVTVGIVFLECKAKRLNNCNSRSASWFQLTRPSSIQGVRICNPHQRYSTTLLACLQQTYRLPRSSSSSYHPLGSHRFTLSNSSSVYLFARPLASSIQSININFHFHLSIILLCLPRCCLSPPDLPSSLSSIPALSIPFTCSIAALSSPKRV